MNKIFERHDIIGILVLLVPQNILGFCVFYITSANLAQWQKRRGASTSGQQWKGRRFPHVYRSYGIH